MEELHCLFCDSADVRCEKESNRRRKGNSRQIFNVFQKHFNDYGGSGLIPPKPKNRNSPFKLFCGKCEDKLNTLRKFDEELERIQKAMSTIVSSLSMEIVQSTNHTNNTGSNDHNIKETINDKSSNSISTIKESMNMFRNAVYAHYSPKLLLIDCTNDNSLDAKLKLKLKLKLRAPSSHSYSVIPYNSSMTNEVKQEPNVDVPMDTLETMDFSQFSPAGSPLNYGSDFDQEPEPLPPIPEELLEKEREKDLPPTKWPRRKKKRFCVIDESSTPTQQIYRCLYCPMTDKFKKRVFDHYKATHRRPKPWGKLVKTNDPTPGSFLYLNEWRIEKLPGEQPKFKDYKCGACGKIGGQQSVLTHIRGFHLGSTASGTKLVCPVCNYIFTSGVTKFIYHLGAHWGKEIPEVISVGEERFIYKARMYFSVVNNNNDDNSNGNAESGLQYKCLHCPSAVTNTQEEILEHLLATHDESFICYICGEEFSTQRGLQMHLRINGDHSMVTGLGDGQFIYTEGKEKWPFYKVEDPEEQATSASSALPAKGKRETYRCGAEGCNVVVQSVLAVKRHIKRMHMENRSAICDVCGRVLCDENALKEHRQTVHSDVDPNSLPWVCDICGDKCTSKRRLQVHKEKHQENKCEACGSLFQYKKGLRFHQRKFCRVLGTSKSSSTKQRNFFRGPRNKKSTTSNSSDSNSFATMNIIPGNEDVLMNSTSDSAFGHDDNDNSSHLRSGEDVIQLF